MPRLAALLASVTGGLLSLHAAALAAPPDFVADEIIVKYRAGAGESQRADVRQRAGATRHADLALIRAEVLKLGGSSVQQAIAAARRHPEVEYAEPNWIVHAFETVPNDPRFSELYAMRNSGQTGGTPGADIRATLAWDLSTGSPDVKVGVIDTGIDYNHPDLAVGGHHSHRHPVLFPRVAIRLGGYDRRAVPDRVRLPLLRTGVRRGAGFRLRLAVVHREPVLGPLP